MDSDKAERFIALALREHNMSPGEPNLVAAKIVIRLEAAMAPIKPGWRGYRMIRKAPG